MSSGSSGGELATIAEDLTAAAMWGEAQLLEGYLLNGVDPNLVNAQGNTALHVASYYGERECANTLLTFKGRQGDRLVIALGIASRDARALRREEGEASSSDLDGLVLSLGRAFVRRRGPPCESR